MEADDIIQQAKGIARDLGQSWDTNLEEIIRFGVRHPETLRARKGVADLHDRDYLTRYVKAYYDELNRPLTLKESTMLPDPAVDVVLETFAHLHLMTIPSADVAVAHRWSMAAENVIGHFLEKYIAEHLQQAGWIWCAGSTVDSADFLKVGQNGEEDRLLQVKNRSNSENSSSSRVRENRAVKIEKWHRIDAANGRTHWDELPDNEKSVMTEAGFQQYIRQQVRDEERS